MVMENSWNLKNWHKFMGSFDIYKSWNLINFAPECGGWGTVGGGTRWFTCYRQVGYWYYRQGPHSTGKTGKMAKENLCQGKHRGFGNFVKTQGKHREFCLNTGKTQGILLAQVVNVLILKVKDIAIVAAQKSIFFQKLDRSGKSVLCM